MSALPFRLVLDATPLIHFAKSGFLAHLPKLGCALLTTPAVIAELSLDSTAFPEAARLQSFVAAAAGSVRVVVPKKTASVPGLSAADTSVILLARELRCIAVLDDTAAHRYARALGVKAVHSTALLVRARSKKRITVPQALAYLDAMIESGWYCDVETYKLVARAIREAK